MTVKVAIIEDQAEQAQLLADYFKIIEDTSYSFEISTFESAEDFLESFFCGQYHLVFADIQLKKMDGLSCMKRVRAMDDTIIIVFITSMAQFAINGYDVGAKDFIVKPLIYDVFEHKLKRLLPMINERKVSLINIAPEGNDPEIVLINDILFVEVFTHKIIYHCKEKDFEVYSSLNEIEKKLSPFGFLRCNRSTLINPAHIKSIRDNIINLGNYELIIGSTRKKAFFHELNSWMNK